MDTLKEFCQQLPYNLSKEDMETLQAKVRAWVEQNPPLFSSAKTSDGFILTFDTDSFVANLVHYVTNDALISSMLAEYDRPALGRPKG